MRIKIKYKIFGYSAFFFLTVFISLLYMRNLLLSDFNEFVEGSNEDKIYWVTNYLEQRYQEDKDFRRVAEDSARLALILGLEVKIFDDNDLLITDTHRVFDDASPIVKKRLKAIYEKIQTNSNKDFVSYPLFSGGEEIGTIEVRKLKDEKTFLFIKRTNTFFIISISISIIGSILFNFLLVYSILKPLNLLHTATTSLGEGDKKTKINFKSNDELGELIESFNMMTDKLKRMEEIRKVSIAKFAHELRTPLTIIQGEIEGAIDGVITLSKERLISLLEEVERLKKMVFDLEDLYKIQKKIKKINEKEITLFNLLEEMVRTFINKFLENKDIKFIIDVPKDLKIYSDEDLLKQMLFNLISNAVKATDRGFIKVTALREFENISFIVEDTGRGIKNEDIPYIFDPFYSNTDGLGVGLAIVKEIIDILGGKISIDSQLNKGTKIKIDIPLKNDIHKNFTIHS